MRNFTTNSEYSIKSRLVNVAIADDHAVVRQGIRSLLERTFCIVGEAVDGLEALRLVEREKPDVLIVDMMMPNMNGIETIRQVKRRVPSTRIIIMSMHSDDAFVAQAIVNGAHGYVLKQASSTDLSDAIYAAFRGEYFFSKPICEDHIANYIQDSKAISDDPHETLTPREREILQLVAEGKTSHQIGQILFISPRTVEVHRANLMRKLNFSTKSDLIRHALKHGLITQ